MMNEARSLMFCSDRDAVPPLAGIFVCRGSPACGSRPLVMMEIRNVGSRLSGTPGSFSIGLSAAPTPPSRLAPWQAVQPAEVYNAAPLLGSPGSAAPEPEAEADGDGDASASVE